jgi:hypothetical protein
MSFEILGTVWFCAGHGNVGVVRVNNGFEIKYYIGQCFGIDEKQDITHIADLGSRFPSEAGDALFGIKNTEAKCEVKYAD